MCHEAYDDTKYAVILSRFYVNTYISARRSTQENLKNLKSIDAKLDSQTICTSAYSHQYI